MGFLSFLQVICGVGSPVAIQTKAAIPPAFTLWLCGASLITGGSAKKTQNIEQGDSNALSLITSKVPIGHRHGSSIQVISTAAFAKVTVCKSSS